MKKLKQIFDKKFFVLVILVFLGTFGTGLVFSSDEIKGLHSGSFKELVNRKIKKEDVGQVDDSGEQKTETPSQDVLGEETEKEATTKETLVQEKESLSTNSVDLVEDARSIVSQMVDILEKDDFSTLYALFGEDLKGAFGEEEFSQAILTAPSIKEVKLLTGPEVSGEWAEAVVELTLVDGSKKQFTVVFHWEDGEWKLFGTEEVE